MFTFLPSSTPSTRYHTPKPTFINAGEEFSVIDSHNNHIEALQSDLVDVDNSGPTTLKPTTTTTTMIVTQTPSSSPRTPVTALRPTIQIDPMLPVPKPTEQPTYSPTIAIAEVQHDDFFIPVEEDNQINTIPSAQPSILPRDETEVVYTFCLDHDILIPMQDILNEASQSISSTIYELFQDDVQVMKNKWNIDEQHLYVESVASIWLENPPARYECMLFSDTVDYTLLLQYLCHFLHFRVPFVLFYFVLLTCIR